MDSVNIKTNYSIRNKDIVVVELGGYIDQTNSVQVEKTISEIIDNGKKNILFDLSNLIYMSSAGWGLFVGEIKRVREMGGDIKITSMSPEVYEVYQMLEFFHIIEDFPTLEEAVASFPIISPDSSTKEEEVYAPQVEKISIDEILEESGMKPVSNMKNKMDEILISEDEEVKIETQQATKREKVKVHPKAIRAKSQVEKMDIARLPLNEKIRKVVANYPLLNIIQIRRMLKHEKFGHTRVGLLKLYRILKLLKLDNKDARYRYFRSM